MRRSCSAAVAAGLLLFAGAASAKIKEKDVAKSKHKVKWKDVVQLEAAPGGSCEFLQKIDGDASSFFVFSGKGMRAKIDKKMQKAAAKVGANAYLVTDKIQVESGASYEAKAYWCDPIPEPADESGTGEAKAGGS
jgi:hypothetical protein